MYAFAAYMCMLFLFATPVDAVVPKVIDLFPDAKTSMTSLLQAHGNLVNGKPANMLVIFHLDHCVFCEMTLGTIMYNFQHDNIFGHTGVQPYQILVSAEGQPVAGHTYCQSNPSCLKEAQELLGVNVSAMTSFPTEYFFGADGKGEQIGDSPCGIAVRGDADSRCSSADLTHCADASVQLDNWVCNMHSSKTPSRDCSSSDWKRCESQNSVLENSDVQADDCTNCCIQGQWFWASCCTNSSISYFSTCPAKCCQPGVCCGAYGYPKDVWDPTCCHASGNSMPEEDSRCTATCPNTTTIAKDVMV